MNMKYERISELLDNKSILSISPSLKLQNDEIYEMGETPVISQNNDFIMGYTNLIDKKLTKPPYIVFGDHTECFKYIKTTFVQGADGIKILKSNSKSIDNLYLYYALLFFYNKTGFYERHFKKLKKTYIGIYDIDIENKLAKILSNYDELIEINNQRIKILVNTAQELYKEWFVRFRYPGNEKDEMILNKTKGWSFGKSVSFCPKSFANYELIKIGEFKRGKNITASEMAEGNVPVISAGLQPSGYHNEFNVEGKSITVSASGANAGYLSYHLDNIWAADCSYCQSGCLWFLYNALKFLQPVITNLQCGSAQPHVYAKNLNRLNLILPNNFELIKKYNDLVSPLYDEIKVLNDKNINLVKQRDSLLPRLMSGKLSVEGKEII